MNEKEVVGSKVFLCYAGYVPCFVEYSMSPVLGKNVKLHSGNQGVFFFFYYLSVNHDEKNDATIYNWLSLNKDKMLNTAPAKSSTQERVN